MMKKLINRVRKRFGWKPQQKSEFRTVHIGASRPLSRNGSTPPPPGLNRQESAVWSQQRDDSHTQQKFPTNVIKSSKYTVLNFLPKNLFEQFRRIANFYFLCMAVIQLTVTSPVEPITSVFPLIFVIGVTMLKQGYEDYLRHVADRQVNNRTACRLSHRGQLEYVRSKDLRVGDILYTRCDQKFPCDAVLLVSSEPDAKAQVQTANLDGETSLKVIKAPYIPQFQLSAGGADELVQEQQQLKLKSFRAQLECEQPHSDLYRFHGNLRFMDPSDGHQRLTSVSEKNLLLGGARLKNTGFTFSAAVYTGRDSKMALNSIYQANKFSALERTLNRFLLFCFITLALEVILTTVLKVIFINTSSTATAWYFLDGKNMFYTTPINYADSYDDYFSANGTHPRSLTGQLQQHFWPHSRPIFGALLNTSNTNILPGGLVGPFGGLASGGSISAAAFLNANQTRPASSVEQIGRVVENLLAFVILFNVIIPISLYVTVECQRFLGSRFIQWDVELYDDVRDLPAKVNCSDLNEALGQVEYLFTDKTGTLTENDMRFRKCSIRGVKYEEKRSSGFLIREKLPRAGAPSINEPIGSLVDDSPIGSQNDLHKFSHRKSHALGSGGADAAGAGSAGSETDGDVTDDASNYNVEARQRRRVQNQRENTDDELDLDHTPPPSTIGNSVIYEGRGRSNTITHSRPHRQNQHSSNNNNRQHSGSTSAGSGAGGGNRRKSSAALLDLSSVDIYNAMRQDKDFELFILTLVLCHSLYVSRKNTAGAANADTDDKDADTAMAKKPSLATALVHPVNTLKKANEYVLGDKNPLLKLLPLSKIDEEHQNHAAVQNGSVSEEVGGGGSVFSDQEKKLMQAEVIKKFREIELQRQRDGLLPLDERSQRNANTPSVFVEKRKPSSSAAAIVGGPSSLAGAPGAVIMGGGGGKNAANTNTNASHHQQTMLMMRSGTAHGSLVQMRSIAVSDPHHYYANRDLLSSSSPDVDVATADADESVEVEVAEQQIQHRPTHLNAIPNGARFSTIMSQVDKGAAPRGRPKHSRSASMSARNGMKSLFYAPQDVPKVDDLSYEGASPDEKALVEACARMGVFFLGQVHEQPGVVALKIRGEIGLRRYRVLHTLEFDNNRRRMSVVVKRVYNTTKNDTAAAAPSPPHSSRPDSSASMASSNNSGGGNATVEFALHNSNMPLDTISEASGSVSRQTSRDTLGDGSSIGGGGGGASSPPQKNSPNSSFINKFGATVAVRGNQASSHRDEILMLVKGADSGVLPIGGRGEVELTARHVDDYSTTGLRCLVIGYKTLSEAEYCSMKSELADAEQTIEVNAREQRMSNIYKTWESNLHVLGATAVEDRLQEHVNQTIMDLRNAGVRVWVLTGDKLDTAVQIANACGHFQRGMRELRLVGLSEKKALHQKLMEIIHTVEGAGTMRAGGGGVDDGMGGEVPNSNNDTAQTGALSLEAVRQAENAANSSSAAAAAASQTEAQAIVPFRGYWMVIDGVSLTTIFADPELELLLTRACLGCVAVLTCRCAPLQKAQIVRLIKENKITKRQPITAAIGDGANDVSMIQEAHVGIGIMGKEGRQAARSADFAMSRFHHLRRMLLVHGHWFYIRIAVLVNYFFYKNFAMVTPQVYYTFENGYSQQSLYDSFFLTFYNMLFSTLPILLFGLIEQRWSEYTLLRRPALYRVNARNCRLSWGQFIKWNLLGVWHATVCYYGARWLWTWIGGGIDIWGKTSDTASFGAYVSIAVILIVNLRLALETRYWTIPTIGGFIITFVIFFASNFLYTGFLWVPLVEHADYYYVFISILASPLLLLGLVVFTLAALLPDILFIIWERQQDHAAYLLARREGGGISGRAGLFDAHILHDNAGGLVMQKTLTGGSLQSYPEEPEEQEQISALAASSSTLPTTIAEESAAATDAAKTAAVPAAAASTAAQPPSSHAAVTQTRSSVGSTVFRNLFRRQTVLVPIVDTVMVDGVGGVVVTKLEPAPVVARTSVMGEEEAEGLHSSSGGGQRRLFPSLNPDKRSISVYDGLPRGTSIHDAEPIVRGADAATTTTSAAADAGTTNNSKRRRGERSSVGGSRLSNPFAFRFGRKSTGGYEISPSPSTTDAAAATPTEDVPAESKAAATKEKKVKPVKPPKRTGKKSLPANVVDTITEEVAVPSVTTAAAAAATAAAEQSEIQQPEIVMRGSTTTPPPSSAIVSPDAVHLANRRSRSSAGGGSSSSVVVVGQQRQHQQQREQRVEEEREDERVAGMLTPADDLEEEQEAATASPAVHSVRTVNEQQQQQQQQQHSVTSPRRGRWNFS